MVSDGFARQGRYMEAAQLLRSGLGANPAHGEGWLALANALVEHAGGRVTPASLMAYGKAEETRSEEHTSELQSLMRISYAVFCLKKKTKPTRKTTEQYI